MQGSFFKSNQQDIFQGRDQNESNSNKSQSHLQQNFDCANIASFNLVSKSLNIGQIDRQRKNNKKRKDDEQSNQINKKRSNYEFKIITNIPLDKLSQKKRFFLTGDLMIDIDYLQSVVMNKESEYLEERKDVSLFKGYKLINKIVHRTDNKFIEIYSEFLDQYFQNVEPILEMIKSLGNASLLQYSQKIKIFNQFQNQFKLLIISQINTPSFQWHKQKRKKYSLELLESFPFEDEMVFFVHYQIDYEQIQFLNCRAGYSQKLYEFLGGNSYAFKQYLTEHGFFDPLHPTKRFNQCFENIQYQMEKRLQMQNIQQQQETKGKDENKSEKPSKEEREIRELLTTLTTLDGFEFPVKLIQETINIDKEYDKIHELNFKVNDTLMVYKFQLLDESILEQLNEVRKGCKFGDLIFEEDDLADKQPLSFEQDKLIQKYYNQDIDLLHQRGNKWFKRCGFVEISQKKLKE